jgi:hypothetical protein
VTNSAGGAVGSARTTAVLDPAFVEGIKGYPTDEVRRRRDESLAEREFQSYLRRQVQVRQDILVAERSRRDAGREPAPLVEQLTSAMAKGPRTRRSRGEAFRMSLTGADIEEAERQLGVMLPDFSLDDPPALEDDELAEALATLSKVERAVSSRRAKVNRVHDRLQEELKRRYRENPAEIPREL